MNYGNYRNRAGYHILHVGVKSSGGDYRDKLILNPNLHLAEEGEARAGAGPFAEAFWEDGPKDQLDDYSKDDQEE